MKIRKATLDDLKEIDLIYVEGCIDEVRIQHPEKSKESIKNVMKKAEKERLRFSRKNLKNPLNLLLVAEINNKIVGFTEASVKKVDQKLEGFWEKAYIKKEFRRRGVGKSLGKEIFKWLKKKKAKSVEAGLFIKNKRSRALCRFFGLKLVAIKMFKELK